MKTPDFQGPSGETDPNQVPYSEQIEIARAIINGPGNWDDVPEVFQRAIIVAYVTATPEQKAFAVTAFSQLAQFNKAQEAGFPSFEQASDEQMQTALITELGVVPPPTETAA